MIVRIDGEPTPKGRPRFSVIKGRAYAYTPEKTRAAEEAMRWHLRSAVTGQPDNESAFHVRMVFAAKSKRADADNFAKLVLDAANGIVWGDDRQVTRLIVDLYRVKSTAEAFTEIEFVTAGKLDGYMLDGRRGLAA